MKVISDRSYQLESTGKVLSDGCDADSEIMFGSSAEGGLFTGYDNHVFYFDDKGEECYELYKNLTPAEKEEIALDMIAKWRSWGGLK